MQERLFIRFQEDGDALDWGVLAADANQFSEQGSLLCADLVSLAETADKREVILLVPATKVLTAEVTAPTRNLRQMQQALPFLLEEQLIAPVDSQHFAIGERRDHQVPVAVVAKNDLDHWLQLCTDAGIVPEVAVADAACLPSFDDAWSLLADGAQLLVRPARDQYWAVPIELFPEALAMHRGGDAESEDGADSILALRLYQQSPVALSENLQGAVAVQNMDIDSPLLLLARNYDPRLINLLQGEYESTHKQSRSGRPWRLAAMLAGLSLLSLLAWKGSQWFLYDQQLAQVQQQTEQLFGETLPGRRMTVNPRLQMQNTLQLGGTSDEGFFTLLDKLAQSLGPDGMTPTSLSYDAKKSELRVDLLARDLDALNRLRQQLASQGLEVEMGSATRQGERYASRLIIRSRA